MVTPSGAGYDFEKHGSHCIQSGLQCEQSVVGIGGHDLFAQSSFFGAHSCGSGGISQQLFFFVDWIAQLLFAGGGHEGATGQAATALAGHSFPQLIISLDYYYYSWVKLKYRKFIAYI
jgi:hypothetical protein